MVPSYDLHVPVDSIGMSCCSYGFSCTITWLVLDEPQPTVRFRKPIEEANSYRFTSIYQIGSISTMQRCGKGRHVVKNNALLKVGCNQVESALWSRNQQQSQQTHKQTRQLLRVCQCSQIYFVYHDLENGLYLLTGVRVAAICKRSREGGNGDTIEVNSEFCFNVCPTAVAATGALALDATNATLCWHWTHFYLRSCPLDLYVTWVFAAVLHRVKMTVTAERTATSNRKIKMKGGTQIRCAIRAGEWWMESTDYLKRGLFENII